MGAWDRACQVVLPTEVQGSFCPHTPHPRQATFLARTDLEVLYGGSAGGGKSEALLMAALEYVDRPHYAALLLRRTYADLSLPGALMDRAADWLRPTAAKWNDTTKTWRFPSGATITFGYLETEKDKYRYQGAELQMIGFDELTQFCVTPETEVLAEGGWKPIVDVDVGERVLSLDPSKRIGYGRVTHTWEFPFEGDLVSVDHERMSFEVTPNHRLVIEGQKNRQWRFCKAKDLPNFAYLPRAGEWVGEAVVTPLRLDRPKGRGIGSNQNSADEVAVDDFLELLGWYLSEGSSFLASKSTGGTSPCVSIRQTRSAPDLDALMRRLPWRASPDGAGGYKVFSRQLFEMLAPLGNQYTKRLPRWVLGLSRRQISIFFEAFMRGDGRVDNRAGSVAVGLCNEGLVDDLQEAAIRLGRPSTKGYQRVRSKYDVWRLNVYAPQLDRVEVRPKHLRRVPYCGLVHCLTVEPNHTFLARHRGRLFWSGNSESQYRYLFSRLRRGADSDIPARMRAASNPGGVGHEWVKARFVNPGDPERPFIPAALDDNPSVDREDYIKSLDRLDHITRAQLLSGDWDVLPEGGLFKREWFSVIEEPPKDCRWLRFWDLAATEPKAGTDPDWSAGALMGRTPSGTYVLAHVERFRCAPLETENRISHTAGVDGKGISIRMEEEGGSSGKIVVAHYLRTVLAGYDFRGVRSTGDKVTRARPVSAQAEGGNIAMVRGAWNAAFLDEVACFPSDGVHDDQVDALSGALAALSVARASRVMDWDAE